MSSVNDSGENEFAYEESNLVGISENTPEKKRIKKYSNQSKRKS